MKNSPQITAPFLVTNTLTYQSNRPETKPSESKSDKNTALPIRKFHSLQRINTVDNQELSTKENEEEDYVVLNETALNSEFRKRLEKIKNSMEIVRNPNLPIELKIRMMESFKDSIQTHFNCVQEANKEIREKMDYLSKAAEEEAEAEQERLIAQAEKNKELQLENILQEDTLTKLRQAKNSLTVSLEDSKDEMADLEALIQEKKRVLENKLKQAEDLRLKMATEKPKKPSTPKMVLLTQEKEVVSATTPQSVSSITSKPIEVKPIETNTSIFQDVSSKLTGFMGNMFSKKPSKAILTPKVIQEISLISKPSITIEPKFLMRKRQSSQSTADSTTRCCGDTVEG